MGRKSFVVDRGGKSRHIGIEDHAGARFESIDVLLSLLDDKMVLEVAVVKSTILGYALGPLPVIKTPCVLLES